MLNKKIKIAAISAMLVIIGAFATAALVPMLAEADQQALESYYNNISYQCETSEDCAVKNVGNCCGAYPACVNKETFVDPSLVEKNCQGSDMAGICGYEEIHFCQCINNRCEPSSDSGAE